MLSGIPSSTVASSDILYNLSPTATSFSAFSVAFINSWGEDVSIKSRKISLLTASLLIKYLLGLVTP